MKFREFVVKYFTTPKEIFRISGFPLLDNKSQNTIWKYCRVHKQNDSYPFHFITGFSEVSLKGLTYVEKLHIVYLM